MRLGHSIRTLSACFLALLIFSDTVASFYFQATFDEVFLLQVSAERFFVTFFYLRQSLHDTRLLFQSHFL